MKDLRELKDLTPLQVRDSLEATSEVMSSVVTVGDAGSGKHEPLTKKNNIQYRRKEKSKKKG
jgi:hypothetical protein